MQIANELGQWVYYPFPDVHPFYPGTFSQWHRSPFMIDGVEYNCAEQWMMAEKARLFGDRKAEDMIMSTLDPREQKRIGRTVIGFDVDQWAKEAKLIVYRGSYAKFRQNYNLEYELCATQGKTLVEASPTDQVWGVGLAVNDNRVNHPVTWRGTNWLGEVLTKLRIDFIGK